MAKQNKPVIHFDADTVWAASAAAQRINGSYVKTLVHGADGNTILPNRVHIENLLEDNSGILAEDYEQGKAVRTYYNGLTFKILQGIKLNEFDNTAMVIANRDIIQSTYDIAVIASLPSCYERAVKRDTINKRIENASGGLIGTIGSKVNLTIEVLRCVFSQQWQTYFISGVTTDDQAVFFSYKNPITIFSIIDVAGKVKAHKGNSTQLSHTKVLKVETK